MRGFVLILLLLLALAWTTGATNPGDDDDCGDGGNLGGRGRRARLKGRRGLNPDDKKGGDDNPCDGSPGPDGAPSPGTKGETPTSPLSPIDPPTPAPGVSPTTTTELTECFSADANVEALTMEGGRFANSVPMKELQVGDLVLTANGGYQPVYAFAHWNPIVRANFLRIQTSSDEDVPLEVSHDHLVYLAGNGHPVPAAAVRVGDALQGEGNATLLVKAVTTISKPGLYAPLTQDGTVVINGVKASSYASLQGRENRGSGFLVQGGRPLPLLSQHDFIHYSLAPFRLICAHYWVPKGTKDCVCQSYDDEGYPYLIGVALRACTWVNRSNVCVQVTALLVWMVLVAPFVALECLVLAPTPVAAVVVLLFGACLARRRNTSLAARK